MSTTTLTFGFVLRWTRFDKSQHVVHVSNCSSPSQAKAIAVSQAGQLGWTPPRWWQWWRWKDTRV